MEKIRQLVDDCIEHQLSFHLDRIGYSEGAILLIGEVIENVYKKDFARGSSLSLAFEILIPRLLANENFGRAESATKIPIEHVLEACTFARNFFHLRNLIYYSYAVESSISWQQNSNEIKISVEDPTIFRQYLAEKHSFMMNSQEKRPDTILTRDQVIQLLKGKSISDQDNPDLIKALASIKEEAEHKLGYQSLGLSVNSTIDIGGFGFNQFLSVYKELLTTALFERMNSIANDLPCVIVYPEEKLNQTMSEQLEMPLATASTILHAISRASDSCFCYLSTSKKFMLFPFTFSLKDGTNDILKLFAKERNNEFSSRASGPLGDSIIAEVSSYFSAFRNFKIVKEILLQKYDKQLPDIDLLIISYEPSLGFHVFVCECKNTLYSSWAKEYLKGVGKKGFITKALSQVSRLNIFLDSEEGNHLLIDIILKEFAHLELKKLFPIGFAVLKNFIIISSQSIGMFTGDEKISIVSAPLFRKIVKASDGDVNYIQGCLRTLKKTIDQSYRKKNSKIKIKDYTISFDVAALKHLLYFPEHTYLATNELENLERDSAETGYTFVSNLGQQAAENE